MLWFAYIVLIYYAVFKDLLLSFHLRRGPLFYLSLLAIPEPAYTEILVTVNFTSVVASAN